MDTFWLMLRIGVVYFVGCFSVALTGTHNAGFMMTGGLVALVASIKWIMGDAW